MMRVVAPDAAGAAASAAQWIASALRETISARGAATLAVSGGSTPLLMFQRLAAEDLPWQRLTVLQVDERIVPADDPQRNFAQQRAALVGRGPLPPQNLLAMPVGVSRVGSAAELAAAAASYGAHCASIDVLHLGLGDDGHTASLLPGDALLDETTALVGLSAVHEGTRRMTLTLPAINAAGRIVWLVTGAAKRMRLRELLQGGAAGDAAGDTGASRLPALRVRRSGAVVFADAAAVGDEDADYSDLAGDTGACLAPETM